MPIIKPAWVFCFGRQNNGRRSIMFWLFCADIIQANKLMGERQNMKAKLIILLMAVALAGCGGGGDSTPAADQTTTQVETPTDAKLGLICPDRNASQADCDYQVFDENGNLAAQWQQNQGKAEAATLAPGCYTVTVAQIATFANDETENYYAGPLAVCLAAADTRYIMAIDYAGAPADETQAAAETLITAACPDYGLDNAYCIIRLYDGFGNYYNGWQWSAGYVMATDITPGCYEYTVEMAGFDGGGDLVDHGAGPAAFCAVENEEVVLDYELEIMGN